MQALILAGGEGKRLRPLTEDRPKPMVLLNGRPLLEYVLEALPDSVTSIVMIVGYRAEQVRSYFGKNWNGHPITYIEQEKPLGTWHAVYLARDVLTEKFIMLYGDDIGDKQAFTKASQYEYCLLTAVREDPQHYGVVELNVDGTLKAIIEKPKNPSSNLVNSGAMILMPDMFDIPPFMHESLGEYLLTDALSIIAKEKPVHTVEQHRWITVTTPDDVPKAEALLKNA